MHAPATTFGFALSERHNNGSLREYLRISEVHGSDLAAGFHAVEPPYTLDNGMQQPAFGYFVGHPAKITGDVAGTSVAAHTAVWSKNPAVTVFWFDNERVTGVASLTGVTAYGSAGQQLATTRVHGVDQ